MARRGKRSGIGGRGFNISTASRRLSPIPYPASRKLSIARAYGVDNRLYHPRRQIRPPRTIYGRRAPVAVRIKSNPYAPRYLNAQYVFKVPEKTAVCVRRSMRREVIFATGRSGGRHRAPRRTPTSGVSCKR